MISIEPNSEKFALTHAQLATISGMTKAAPDVDYDIVEGDQGRGLVWLWVHWEGVDPSLTPTRYWIEADGSISNSEDVDWDWQGVVVATPEGGIVDQLIEQGPVEESFTVDAPEGMVTVEVEWFRGEQFAGTVWVEEGLEEDPFAEAVEDAIHNLSQSEENAAFDGCTDFRVTKTRIIPKEEANG